MAYQFINLIILIYWFCEIFTAFTNGCITYQNILFLAILIYTIFFELNRTWFISNHGMPFFTLVQ